MLSTSNPIKWKLTMSPGINFRTRDELESWLKTNLPMSTSVYSQLLPNTEIFIELKVPSGIKILKITDNIMLKSDIEDYFDIDNDRDISVS